MKKLISILLSLSLLFSPASLLADEVRYETDPNFPQGSFSLTAFRNNLRGMAQMDVGPLITSAKQEIDGMEWPTDAAAQAEYAGTGVTITSDSANEQEGSYSLKAVTDGTANRSFERTIALDLSDFLSVNLWARSSATSDSIQFFLRDSGGDESRWDFTTNGSANTWEEETLTLASPDSNNGTNADLSDISVIGFRALSSSTTYYFDTTEAVVGMTVVVRGTNLGEYYRNVYLTNQPLSISQQAAPTITAPTTNPRIDILQVNGSGTLSWVTGTEASTPAVPWASRDTSQIPIALVYMKTTMTKVLEYTDKDTDTNQGYILADVRPFLSLSTNLSKGADVASASSMTLGNDGNFFDITGNTTITSITAKPAGTVVWLQFDGVLTVTDGSNLKLNGNFITAAESTLQLVSDGTNWYEVSRSPVPSTFLTQTDTPSSYSGQALKVTRVNAGQTALEFHTPKFTDGSDTPSSYSGQANKVVSVNSGETAVEFTIPEMPGVKLIAVDSLTTFTTSTSFSISPDKRYFVTYVFEEPTSNIDGTIYIRFNSDSTTNSYKYSMMHRDIAGSTLGYNTDTGNYILIGGIRRNSGAFSQTKGHFYIDTFKDADSAYSAAIWGKGFGNTDGGGGTAAIDLAGAFNKNVTISSFQFTVTTTCTAAEIRVYELDDSL